MRGQKPAWGLALSIGEFPTTTIHFLLSNVQTCFVWLGVVVPSTVLEIYAFDIFYKFLE